MEQLTFQRKQEALLRRKSVVTFTDASWENKENNKKKKKIIIIIKNKKPCPRVDHVCAGTLESFICFIVRVVQ